MDDELRRLERAARAGDLDAAYAWLRATNRTGDYAGQYQALMTICDLQTSPEFKRLQALMDEVDRMLPKLPAVEDPPFELVTGPSSGSITIRR